MFSIVFTQAAREELLAAQDWYEREAGGLGRRFRVSIGLLVDRISTNPRQFPLVVGNVRRALLRRFPYALLFCVKEDTIVVIACFHGSRDPIHWHNRV